MMSDSVDAAGRDGGRHEEPLRIGRTAKAYVTVAVDDSLMVENVVSGDQIVDQFLQFGHRCFSLCLAAREVF